MSATAKRLTKDVLRHANKLHGIVSAAGNEAAADRLTAEADRWSGTTTEAVVAGDIKRGKSSLINAVIGRPDLLPVDADVATAVHLAVTHGDPERVTVTMVDPESSEPDTIEISPTDLSAYASMAGDADLIGRVSSVEVAIDHPLLAEGLDIIDTPGVGGMTRGHRDITMAALRRADLLVFVVSCVEPVSRTELEFLAEASERIGNVVLVATRADLSTAETNVEMIEDLGRRIGVLADERAAAGDAAAARRLRRMAGQPVIPTSAFLAEQARRREERGRTEQAAELRRQSGMDELGARLELAVDTREHVRLANLLQLLSAIGDQVLDEQTARLRALDGDTGIQDELKARSADLEAAAGMQARWRNTLATGINRMQTGAGRDVSRELTLVRDHYRMVIEEHGDDLDLDAFGFQLQQSLGAAWANLAAAAGSGFDDVIRALLDDLQIEGEPGLLGEMEMPPGIQGMIARRGGGTEGFDALEDALPLAMQTFMFGNIATGLGVALGIVTGGLGLAAYGIGAAISAPIMAMRRRQRKRRKELGELQRSLNEALFGQEGIAREFTTELTLRILDARQSIESMIEERLSTRRRELETQRKELQDLLRSETATRTSGRQEAERKIAEINVFKAETERLTAAVDAAIEEAISTNAEPDGVPDVISADEPAN